MACFSGLDICVQQGNYYSLSITVTDNNGNVIDLTDYSGYAPIRSNYGATGSIIDQFNLSFDAPTSGVMSIYLTAQETASLPVSQLTYMLEIYPTGSTQYAQKYLMGYMSVEPEL